MRLSFFLDKHLWLVSYFSSVLSVSVLKCNYKFFSTISFTFDAIGTILRITLSPLFHSTSDCWAGDQETLPWCMYNNALTSPSVRKPSRIATTCCSLKRDFSFSHRCRMKGGEWARSGCTNPEEKDSCSQENIGSLFFTPPPPSPPQHDLINCLRQDINLMSSQNIISCQLEDKKVIETSANSNILSACSIQQNVAILHKTNVPKLQHMFQLYTKVYKYI